MMCERRAPGVQHERGTDLGAEVSGIGGDGAQRVSGEVEQQPVDDPLVVPGDRADGGRQREDEVIILERQQISLARFEPAASGSALALGAMAVAARVVGDLGARTAGTAQHMSAQRRAAALFDG